MRAMPITRIKWACFSCHAFHRMVARLPLELQTKILALSGRWRRHAASNLMVSRATYPSMERLLYQSIVLCGEHRVKRFLACIILRSMHMEFANKSIKSLCVFGPMSGSTLIELLAVCRGVTCLSLAVHTDAFYDSSSSLLRVLDQLPLKSLVIVMDINCKFSVRRWNLFQNITHLEIANELLVEESYTGFNHLRSLTHLLVVLIPNQSFVEFMKRICLNAMLRLIGLRVTETHNEVTQWLNEYSIHDARVVLMPIDWICWAKLGQGNMLEWELAEGLLKRPIPAEGHRCLLIQTIKNAYKEYDNVERSFKPVSCSQVSSTKTKRLRNDIFQTS